VLKCYTHCVLEVRLLGQFDVRLDGRPVDLASRPAQSLLAYLLLTAGTPHRREQLAALFWPDTTDANARSNLRHALWRLRSALDLQSSPDPELGELPEAGGGFIIADPQTVAFNLQSDYWLDVDVLQQEFSGDWPVEALVEAVAVYNGDLLPGFYADWVDLERGRMRAALDRQMQLLMDRLVSDSRWADVLHCGERWIALGGAPEPAFRALMTAYAGLGDMAGLATTYHRCENALQSELAVEPSTQTRTLFEQLSRGGGPAAPAPTPAPSDGALAASRALTTEPAPRPSPPHNLPGHSTPFVGREETLDEIARRLDDPACRLLTLCGPGGIGKTRLGLQAAQGQIGKHPDGVFYVPLAPVGSADLIIPAIAGAISFSFYGGTDPGEQLLGYLRDKHMLLLLDNFEHLVDGAGLIAELLEKCPGVRCLVTSRERLNLHSEWLVTVEGLSVPEPERINGVEQYSAIQLFVQSARRVQAAFTLGENDRLHAVRLCRLVEGMPLAIELASAWLRTISVHEIVREIERSLDFLSTTMRDLPQRHRSLRAVFDHSWDLLGESERQAFQRLSVFRGGFQRESAEAVADASLVTLSALMDKSLLRRSASGRYEIHELLRQYARDKLAGSDEEALIRERHLAYYLKLAEAAEPELRQAGQLDWLSRLDLEHDNLRVALKWAKTNEQFEEGLRLAAALSRFWYLHGYWNEGREWLAVLLDLTRDGPADRAMQSARVRALNGAAWLEDESGDDIPLYKQSLGLCHEIGDRWSAGFAMRGLGAVEMARGDDTRAREWLLQSLAAFEEVNDGWGAALAKYNLGWLALNAEENAQRARYWDESLAGFRRAGDRWGMAVTLGALSYTARFTGDYKGAAEKSAESLALFKALGDRAGMAESLARLASVAYRRSDYQQATELYEASVTLKKELGDYWGAGEIMGVLGLVAAYQGDYARATELLEASIRENESMSGLLNFVYLKSYLAMTAFFEARIERATALWQETLAFYREQGDRGALAYSLYGLGVAALARGEIDRATAQLQESYDLSQGLGDKRGISMALHGLGKVARAQGDPERARSCFQQAITLRKEMGDKQGLAESLEGLAGALIQSGTPALAEKAARLLGAAEHLREKIGAPLPPVDRATYERDVSDLRAQLGDAPFGRTWTEGRETKLGEILQQAPER
jgi:predicted ATPase/DNA-binding SARP family transcriptional activator